MKKKGNAERKMLSGIIKHVLGIKGSIASIYWYTEYCYLFFCFFVCVPIVIEPSNIQQQKMVKWFWKHKWPLRQNELNKQRDHFIKLLLGSTSSRQKTDRLVDFLRSVVCSCIFYKQSLFYSQLQVTQVEVLWQNKLRQPAHQGCLEAEKKKDL